MKRRRVDYSLPSTSARGNEVSSENNRRNALLSIQPTIDDQYSEVSSKVPKSTEKEVESKTYLLTKKRS